VPSDDALITSRMSFALGSAAALAILLSPFQNGVTRWKAAARLVREQGMSLNRAAH
jgi:hypothetical protein